METYNQKAIKLKRDKMTKTNENSEIVVQAFFESLALTLEGILDSAEALVPTLSTLAERRLQAIEIAHASFQSVEKKRQFQDSNLKEFNDLRREFLRVWKSISEPKN